MYKVGDILKVVPTDNWKLSCNGASVRVVRVAKECCDVEFLHDISSYTKGHIFHRFSNGYLELDKNQIVIDILNDL